MWLQGHWYNGWSDLTGNRVAIKVAVVANNKMLIRKVHGMISGTGCARGYGLWPAVTRVLSVLK